MLRGTQMANTAYGLYGSRFAPVPFFDLFPSCLMTETALSPLPYPLHPSYPLHPDRSMD